MNQGGEVINTLIFHIIDDAILFKPLIKKDFISSYPALRISCHKHSSIKILKTLDKARQLNYTSEY